MFLIPYYLFPTLYPLPSLFAAAAKDLAPVPPFAYASRADDPDRPQLHFAPKLGWANDPNGLSWHDGEWHLFHQHNPTSVEWGNMHWNHAVSKDLVHWRELGDALCPDELGDMWSGCAVTDAENTAGFGKGAHVLLYSAFCKGPPTQCLAYSLDGRNYRKYAANPVLPTIDDQNRDPKVFWHKPTRKWVMALYGVANGRNVVMILTSSDLKKWERRSDYVGSAFTEKNKTFWLCECPGLEELAIEGDGGTAWVVWGGGAEYAVGAFDGERFVPSEERLCGFVGSSYYAAQTFVGDPAGRSLWLAWYKLPSFQGASYRHAFSLPQELSLRRTGNGLRLVRRPARELKALRSGAAVPLAESRSELLEIDLAARLEPNAVLKLDVRGVPVRYDAKERRLTVGKTSVEWQVQADGVFAVKMFVDRVGIEVFARDGLQMAAFGDVVPERRNLKVSLDAQPGVAITEAAAYPLKSIWGEEKVEGGRFEK